MRFLESADYPAFTPRDSPAFTAQVSPAVVVGDALAQCRHGLENPAIKPTAWRAVMDLFSDSISLSLKLKSERLSKPQKLFNSLISRIEKQRALLAGWEAVMPRFQQHYSAELQPIIERTAALRMEFVLRLDWAYTQKGLSKTERRFLRDLLSDLAGELANETDNAEMKALYHKYVGVDFDQEEAEMMAEMKAMMEHELGMDLGDELDMSSPDAFLSQVRARLAEAQETKASAERARRAKRKKSVKQHAREEKLHEEAKRMNLSLREIYRKLASALHPDRELDPAERERKTALMQRVNQAYDKKNLLQLLELQLEIEQLDRATINSLGEERLAHYNMILKEQLRELEEQVRYVDYDFRMRFGMDPYTTLKPESLMRILDKDIVLARQTLRDIEADVNAAQNIATLKTLLKEMRRQQRENDFYDVPF
jgi:hypothetical protein